ncbi:MAG: 30S ribosomal protein S16 [Clostridia bacterium]
MAVKLRLTRMGAKKAPTYRIIAIDERKARDAQYLDNIGFYDPTKKPSEIRIDSQKALDWLAKGAQPTDTVRGLLKKQEIIK